MDYQIYKTPDPSNRLDASIRYEKSISELLLTFDYEAKEGISKIVTVPAQNEIGLNVAACQTFFGVTGYVAYVMLPETEQLYSFTEAIVPIKGTVKSFLKAGFKGLIFGAEEKVIISQTITEDDDVWLNFCGSHNISQADWYHFTGNAKRLLEELKQKSKILL